jgi:hypothetical protein
VIARQRRTHIWPKAKNSWYVEPFWVSQRLFDVENFDDDVIYDPACGSGRILKSAADHDYTSIGSDIVKRGKFDTTSDFLSSRPWRPTSSFSIVCNPPFDHVEEFFQRALQIGARKIAMICLLRRLPAAHWLERLPITTIYLLTPRPSMPPGEWIEAGNAPGGGTQDFVWVVARHGAKGQPKMQWLSRDKK